MLLRLPQVLAIAVFRIFSVWLCCCVGHFTEIRLGRQLCHHIHAPRTWKSAVRTQSESCLVAVGRLSLGNSVLNVCGADVQCHRVLHREHACEAGMFNCTDALGLKCRCFASPLAQLPCPGVFSNCISNISPTLVSTCPAFIRWGRAGREKKICGQGNTRMARSRE